MEGPLRGQSTKGERVLGGGSRRWACRGCRRGACRERLSWAHSRTFSLIVQRRLPRVFPRVSHRVPSTGQVVLPAGVNAPVFRRRACRGYSRCSRLKCCRRTRCGFRRGTFLEYCRGISPGSCPGSLRGSCRGVGVDITANLAVNTIVACPSADGVTPRHSAACPRIPRCTATKG